MEIKFIGFVGKPIEKLRGPFEDLMSKLAQGLELDFLKYIIISEDFKTELFKFQKSYVFSWPVLRLAFVDCPALSVPKLPESS